VDQVHHGRRLHRFRSAWLALLLLICVAAAHADKPVISEVSTSKPSFNPSLGQKSQVAFSVSHAGVVNVRLLDRDGYLVRRLAVQAAVEKGRVSFDWDGRDDKGEVVADEAYSIQIDFTVSNSSSATYSPASTPGRDWSIKPKYYDRRGGILAYTLPVACRVHAQAGTAKVDKVTGKISGPVLKTLVNREPRPAGAVIEQWNGFDDSGTINVAELADFKIAISVSALPDNSIIAFGNRVRNFLSYASGRIGSPMLPRRTATHEHHRGLSALDDVSPDLSLSPQHASWVSNEHLWATNSTELQLVVSLRGMSVDHFVRQPTKLYVFLDGKPVSESTDPKQGMVVSVPLNPQSSQPQVVALNWASEYGPVAVAALRASTRPGLGDAAIRRK